MLAVVISLMDEAYFKIAIWLNDKGKSEILISFRIYLCHFIIYYSYLHCCSENYRLETKYENHLIGKVALVCIFLYGYTAADSN